MNWIKKYEKKQQEEFIEEKQKHDAQIKKELEEKDQFQIIKDKLCPLIETSINRIKKHFGLELSIKKTDTSISVIAPVKPPASAFDRITPHYFEISLVSNDIKTVHIEAIKGGVTNVSQYKCPDDMPMSDWRGIDKTVISTDNRLDKLVSEDLNLLFEWLTKMELEDKVPSLKNLSSIRRRERLLSKAFLKAKVGPTIAIVGFILYFVHPFFTLLGALSIYFGIKARHELTSLNKLHLGDIGTKWAIGLGIFDLLMLLIYIDEVL